MKPRLGLMLMLLHVVGSLSYSIPEPKLELLNPTGFRISIPDESDIHLVAFHLNVNSTIVLNQPGTFAAEIKSPTNGRWVFDNTLAFVNPGTLVGFWIHVQHRNLAYRKLGSAVLAGEPVDITEPTSGGSQSTYVHRINSILVSSTSRKTSSKTEARPPTTESRRPPSAAWTQARPSSTARPPSAAAYFPSTACEKSPTTVDHSPACKGQLIFDDNFDKLNWTTWKHDVRMSLDLNDAEFVSYQSRSENCYINDGALHIVPNLLSEVPGFSEASIRSGYLDLGKECTATVDIDHECTRRTDALNILPPIVSARINTKNSFSFRYGRVEVRAKMPKGDWLFPLILLEPLENYYGFTGFASGEMRVAYIRGNERLEDRNGADIGGSQVSGGVILGITPEVRDFGLKSSSRKEHLGTDYHTYALTWADDHISLEIDGNEYSYIRGGFSRLHQTHGLAHASLWDNGNVMAPFDREFFLTLGVAAGGHSDFPDRYMNGKELTRKPWRNRNPRAELNFWNDRENWLRTWSGDDVGLHVDYVRVYAL